MRLALDLAPDLSAPSRARVSLRALSLGLAPHVLRDVQLVVSELIAHAVDRGPGERLRVEIALDAAGVVRGEVIDQGEFVGAPAKRTAQDRLALSVVDELADDWGVTEGSNRVWFVLGDGERPRQ